MGSVARFFLGLLAVLLIFYFAGSYLLLSPLVKGPVTRKLSTTLGYPVHIERVKFSPLAFRLQLFSIRIGEESLSADNDKQPLLNCRSLECDFDPLRLLYGKLACKRFQVESLHLRVIRDQDGGYNFPANSESSLSGWHIWKSWPEWLELAQIAVLDSEIFFDDKLSGKTYRIEKIRFLLPRLGGTAVPLTPRFSALVNDTLIELDGVSTALDNGDQESRIQLNLNGLNLGDIVSYLPENLNIPTVDEGKVNLRMHIAFSGTDASLRHFRLQGQAELADIVLTTPAGMALDIPAGWLSLQARPGLGEYRIETLRLHSPELMLSGNGITLLEHLAPPLASLAGREDLNLAIDNLFVTNGRIRMQPGPTSDTGTIWDDVSLELKDFAPDQPASLFLQGKDRYNREKTFSFQGTVQDPAFIRGKLTLRNIDLSGPANDLLGLRAVRFSKGRGHLEADLDLHLAAGDPKLTLLLANANLAGDHFVLSDGDNPILSGRSLRCSAMRSLGDGRGVSCEQLALENTELTPAIFRFLSAARPGKDNTPRIVGRELDIRKASLVLDLPFRNGREKTDDNAEVLRLTDVNLHLTPLAAGGKGSENFTLTGRLGREGTVDLRGFYHPGENRGQVKLAADGIDILLFRSLFHPWFRLPLKEGTLDLAGVLDMPSGKYQGNLTLENFQAGQKEAVVSWKRATSSQITLTPEPWSLNIQEIIFKAPSLTVFHGEQQAGPPVPLLTKLVDVQLLDSALANQRLILGGISVEEGQAEGLFPLLDPSYYPSINSLAGALSALDNGRIFSFSCRGKIDDTSDFTLEGQVGLREVDMFSLKTTNVVLKPVAGLFNKRFGMVVDNATAEWELHYQNGLPAASRTGEMTFYNIHSLAGSTFDRTLALLLDNENRITVPLLYGEQSDGDHTILTGLEQGLTRYQRKLSLSPRELVNEFFPLLELPERVLFTVGQDRPQDLFLLDDYLKLLAHRPRINLLLVGSYDDNEDRDYLRQILQEEVDARIEVENLRREQKRQELVERQRQRIAAMHAGKVPDKPDDEEEELDLRMLMPLPAVQVVIEDKELIALALKRAVTLRTYLVEELGIDGQRIIISREVEKNGAGVDLRLQPNW